VSVSASKSSAVQNHETWLPVLELAAQEVFETMLSSHVDVNPEAPDYKGLDVTAMVGFAGSLCGVLTIRCSSHGGAMMASKMLGIEVEKAAAEMWDALGEVCNMVAGNFKNKISGLGDGCMLSVPTVITGGDYQCHSMGESNTLLVNFLFEKERVVMAIEIHS
jgi:chemotaxis protein CheX